MEALESAKNSSSLLSPSPKFEVILSTLYLS